MIYLIGGVARVGKTTLANKMTKNIGTSSFSTDVLRNLLDRTTAEPNILELKWVDRPDVFFKYLKGLIYILQNKYENYIVEGDIFFPEHVEELKKGVDLRCCFLGGSKIAFENLTHEKDRINWVNKMSKEEQKELPENIQKYSNMLQNECKKFGYTYFDIYPNREEVLEEAYQYLVN